MRRYCLPAIFFQRITVLFIKGNDQIAFFRIRFLTDDDQIPVFNPFILHGITGGMQDIKRTVAKDRRRKSRYALNIFLLIGQLPAGNAADQRRSDRRSGFLLFFLRLLSWRYHLDQLEAVSQSYIICFAGTAIP